MYRDTVTVFCRYNGHWKGTVLNNVDFNADRAAIIAQYGEKSQDRAKLHIRYKGNDDVNGVRFVSPLLYRGEENTFTLDSGNNFSFFMEGVGSILSADDSDYLDGFFDYMNRTADCFVVSSWAKYSVIPHFEIMGK